MNCEQSLANHLKMEEVVEALGVPTSLNGEQARQRIRGLPLEAEQSARVQAAIDRQTAHFDTLGLDLGHLYEAGAFVPDGTPARQPENTVSDYLPTTRPGARLPHAWLTRGNTLVSTLDLVDPIKPVMLTGRNGKRWSCRSEGRASDVRDRGERRTRGSKRRVGACARSAKPAQSS